MSRACEPHQLAIMSPATTVDIVRHVCKSFGLLAIKTRGLGPLPLSLGGTLWVTWQTECSKVILFRKGPSASADLSQEPQSNGTSQVEIVVKNPAINAGDYKRHGFNPWVWKIPWRRTWQPIPVFLPGEPHGQRSLAGFNPWSHKSWTIILCVCVCVCLCTTSLLAHLLMDI